MERSCIDLLIIAAVVLYVVGFLLMVEEGECSGRYRSQDRVSPERGDQ
jgi:hypothetical protein